MDKPIEFKIERIHKLSSNGPVKAFADLNINDSIIVKGLRIVEGRKGLFVAMPQEQGKDKKWYDMVRCISKETRLAITDAALSAYQGDGMV